MLYLKVVCMKHIIAKIGDSLYLSHQKIIVCDFIYPFQLVVVRYENDTREFVVDQGALSHIPLQSHSIPITLFKGDRS